MKVKTDDLGRIVIPKSIRTELNISSHNILNIYLKNNKIIIEKDEEDYKNKFIIENYLRPLSNLSNFNCILISDGKIIFTSQKYNNYMNKKISKELKRIIDTRSIIRKSNNIKIIDDEYIEGKFSVHPIMKGIFCIGTLIIDEDKAENLELPLQLLYNIIEK